MFDAFFYIQPKLSFENTFNPCSSWTYPEDVSNITNEFRDIPNFCFPDIDVLKIERADFSTNEYFVFFLTDSDGNRVYGICLRFLPKGEGGRFDVRRRTRDCLCIISRHAFFSTFRSVLTETLALLYLDDGVLRAKRFLGMVMSSTVTPGECITIRTHPNDASRNFQLYIPMHGGSVEKETPLHPLLLAIGVERFLLILSAALCERRIIVVGDKIDAVSAAVLAAGAMLHPFTWQHIFLPVLPSKLLNYAAAPLPYIIGLKRHQYAMLPKEAVEDVVVVDLDSGDCVNHGGVPVHDIMGSAVEATAASVSMANMKQQASEGLKQASEGVWAMAKATNKMFMGGSSGGSYSNYSGTTAASMTSTSNSSSSSSSMALSEAESSMVGRDVMSLVVSDIRSVLSRRPGATSSSMTLFRLPMSLAGRSATEVARDRWPVDCERVLREALLLFFSYLFCDIDFSRLWQVSQGVDSVNSSSSSSRIGNDSGRNGQQPFTAEDVRTDFVAGFLQKRQGQGDSKELIDFLSEFFHSQMFERFCGDKANQGSVEPILEYGDVFDLASFELRSRVPSATPTLAKQVVGQLMARRDAYSTPVSPSVVSGGASGSSDPLEVIRAAESSFHPLALQYTSGSISSTKEEQSLLDALVVASHNSQQLPRILRAIWFRLDEYRQQGGSSKAGHKSLQLLHCLLVRGPEAVFVECLQELPLLKELCRMKPRAKSARLVNNTDLMATTAMQCGESDVPDLVYYDILLILDNKRLKQRRVCADSSLYPNPYLTMKPQREELFIALKDTGSGSVTLLPPDFQSVHQLFRPPNVPLSSPSPAGQEWNKSSVSGSGSTSMSKSTTNRSSYDMFSLPNAEETLSKSNTGTAWGDVANTGTGTPTGSDPFLIPHDDVFSLRNEEPSTSTKSTTSNDPFQIVSPTTTSGGGGGGTASASVSPWDTNPSSLSLSFDTNTTSLPSDGFSSWPVTTTNEAPVTGTGTSQAANSWFDSSWDQGSSGCGNAVADVTSAFSSVLSADVFGFGSTATASAVHTVPKGETSTWSSHPIPATTTPMTSATADPFQNNNDLLLPAKTFGNAFHSSPGTPLGTSGSGSQQHQQHSQQLQVPMLASQIDNMFNSAPGVPPTTNSRHSNHQVPAYQPFVSDPFASVAPASNRRAPPVASPFGSSGFGYTPMPYSPISAATGAVQPNVVRQIKPNEDPFASLVDKSKMK